MPRQDWQKNTNRGRKALPEELPVDTICVKTYIPNHYQYVGLFIGSLNRLAMQSIYDRDITKKAKEVASLWKLANQLTFASLDEGCGSNIIGGGGGGGGVILPDCITTESNGNEFVINIQECCDMTVIVNIKDCCCGGGGGSNITGQGSFGGGSSGGGGASGGWTTEPQTVVPYSGLISGCEMLTGGVVEYILSDQKDMLLGIGNSGGIITNVIDFFATYNPVGVITSDGVDWLTDQATEAMSNAAELWVLQEFRFQAKEAWAKTFGDRQWKQVTRSELLQWAANIPRIWYVGLYPVAARAIMQGLIRFQNMARINQQLALASGECDIDDYQYYLAGAGVPYLPPSNQAELPAPGLGFAYEWGRRYDMTISGTDGWTLTNSLWEDGLGVRGLLSSPPNDYQIILHKNLSAILTGVRLTLDEPMNGDADSVRLGLSAGTTEILGDTATNELVIVRPLDYTISANMYLLLREWEYAGNASDNFTQHLVYIDLFGTGSAPAGGTEI